MCYLFYTDWSLLINLILCTREDFTILLIALLQVSIKFLTSIFNPMRMN